MYSNWIFHINAIGHIECKYYSLNVTIFSIHQFGLVSWGKETRERNYTCLHFFRKCVRWMVLFFFNVTVYTTMHMLIRLFIYYKQYMQPFRLCFSSNVHFKYSMQFKVLYNLTRNTKKCGYFYFETEIAI